MNTLANALHDLLPLLGAILLGIGIKKDRINFVIAALWLSLIVLLIHYQTAGGEILGNHFGYKNAATYTLNLLVLIISLLCLFIKLPLFQGKVSRYFTGFFSTVLVIGGSLLLTNLWVNAYFIENRHPGTPIMQVATFAPIDYCTYRYVFYRIDVDGKISYLCPNHFGIIPSIGQVDVSPAVILNHLARQITAKPKMDNKSR